MRRFQVLSIPPSVSLAKLDGNGKYSVIDYEDGVQEIVKGYSVLDAMSKLGRGMFNTEEFFGNVYIKPATAIDYDMKKFHVEFRKLGDRLFSIESLFVKSPDRLVFIEVNMKAKSLTVNGQEFAVKADDCSMEPTPMYCYKAQGGTVIVGVGFGMNNNGMALIQNFVLYDSGFRLGRHDRLRFYTNLRRKMF